MNNIKIFILFLYFGWSPSLMAQIINPSDTARFNKLYKEAKDLYAKKHYSPAILKYDSVEQYLAKSDTLSVLWGDIQAHKAFSMLYAEFPLRNNEKAFTISNKLLAQFKTIWHDDSEAMAFLLETKGIALSKLIQYNKSNDILLEALKLRSAISDESKTTNIINILSVNYARIGNYEKAVFYSTKQIEITQRKADRKTLTRMSLNLYGALAVHYKNLGDYDKSLFYHNHTVNLMQEYWPISHPLYITEYQNRGITKKRLGLFDEAIADFDSCYRIALFNWKEGENPDFGGICLNRADVFFQRRDYEKAIKDYEKAIFLLQKFKEEEISIAECHYGMAECYLKLQNWQSAKENVYRAKHFNHYDQEGNFEDVIEMPLLINTLQSANKIYLLAYEQTKQKIYLDSAYQTAQLGLNAVNFLRKEMSFSEARSRLTKDYYQTYENYISTLKMLGQDSLAKKAFIIAEQSKALQLYEAIKNAEVLSFGKIPPQYLAQEKQFQSDLNKLEERKKSLVAKKTQESDSIFIQVTTMLYEGQIKYDALKNELAKNYSNYYHLKYENENITVANLQTQLLQPNQTLVEYFVGDSSLFAFVVKPNVFEFIEIKKDFPLEEWVKLLRGSLSADSFQIKADVFAGISFQLYEKLVKPFKSKLSEEVIIVPDGILGYIPFEALLMKKPEKANRFQSHAYLLRDHNISYSFSATLLREMIQKKHATPPNKSLLAYAPFYDGDTMALAKNFADDMTMRRNFSPLRNSGEEAYRIAKSMGGEAIIGKEATEQKFIETAQSARILHLATHGQADDKSNDYSFLAFTPLKDSLENGLLYVRDLYNLTLNADLVVLSACETGIGQLQRGEGIISLARAFAYSGAKSIVTSLWSVNDAKTKDLMLLFYKNLKKGKTKDGALREAKLSFMDKNTHPNAHPFFWAGFIGIGDMSKLR